MMGVIEDCMIWNGCVNTVSGWSDVGNENEPDVAPNVPTLSPLAVTMFSGVPWIPRFMHDAFVADTPFAA